MDINYVRPIAASYHLLDASLGIALRPASGYRRQAAQPGHPPCRRTICSAIPRGSRSSHGNQAEVTSRPNLGHGQALELTHPFSKDKKTK